MLARLVARSNQRLPGLPCSTAPAARRMSTFLLPKTEPAVEVGVPDNLSQQQLLSFSPFNNWVSTLQSSLHLQTNPTHPFHGEPYRLRRIEIQAVDFFGAGRIGFLKLKADVSNEEGEKLPGAVFLRGGSVGMMLILQPDDVPEGSEDDKYVILTLQPRVPAGSLAFAELPAGMLDGDTFTGGAAKEIKEETGIEIAESELINMTALALSSPPEEGEELQSAFYPSCGGSDEFIPMFLWQKRISRHELLDYQGKLTGLRDQGEKITLNLVKLEEVWKVGGRDGKVLAGYALYQGLKKEGKI